MNINLLTSFRRVPVLGTFVRRGLSMLLLAGFSAAAFGQSPPVLQLNTNPSNPSAGVPFAVLGPLPSPAVAAPTVFVFGAGRNETITKKSFVNAARDYLRVEHGFLVVSLDMPAHQDDLRPGETEGLAGWRTRLAAGENVVTYFTARATAVLNYLISAGYTDPNRVAAIGISRGGFMATHWMIANSGVGAVAAISPVTKLRYLAEFATMGAHPLTDSLNLENFAANVNLRKPLWITIGNNDTRVGTDLAIDFARDVAAAAPAGTLLKDVYLQVRPSDNHHQPLYTHPDAADWIAEKLP